MKRAIFGILLFFFCFSLSAQADKANFSYNGSGSYYLVERTDLRRYDNGKYTGLVTRKVRSFISRSNSPETNAAAGTYYDGYFFVEEDTRRGVSNTFSGIHDSIAASFRITNDGSLFMLEDNGYPTFRSFPAFPDTSVHLGEKWISKAERAVDPLHKGIITKIPMTIEYTYLRDEEFNGEKVYVLSAQWATRYGISYWDFGGDRELKSASGSHKATMYISCRTGNAVVVRDAVDETFIYSDGNQVTFKGTISLFTEYPPAVDRSRIIPALQRASLISETQAEQLAAAESQESAPAGTSSTVSSISMKNDLPAPPEQKAGYGKEKTHNQAEKHSSPKDESFSRTEKPITVENTTAGLRLTIQNIKFQPDSSNLLPGEDERLNQIATILKEAPASQFLVEGHTASTGNEKGEQKLSEERAHAIAAELVSRGISAGRFICKGSGGKKPVANNSTAEGKAKNRRVEITILE